MKTLRFIVSAALVGVAIPVHADKTYTPEQLRMMVQSGTYPDQGPLAIEQTSNMSWLECLAKTESIIKAVTPNYPSQKIVETKVMTSTKLWVNDSSITLTCYADGRLHLTSAPYK